MRRSKKGALTSVKRRVQYGFISRYSTRFRPAAISRNHALLMVVVIFGRPLARIFWCLAGGLLAVPETCLDSLSMYRSQFSIAF
jgi:hypothetical protein